MYIVYISRIIYMKMTQFKIIKYLNEICNDIEY